MQQAVPQQTAARIEALRPGYIVPNAARTIPRHKIHSYAALDRRPRFGDVIYGRIVSIGNLETWEDLEGRLLDIADGTHAIFVYGTRYSPDVLEGIVPDDNRREVMLLVESGVVGVIVKGTATFADPTRIEVLGYALDERGAVLNTLDHAPPASSLKGNGARARMVLNVGTSMNSGKTSAAVTCCRALATLGHEVRAAKVTGTACPSDVLRMRDAGASAVADFTDLGWPSTYLIDEPDLIGIFERLDAEHASDPDGFWVVEFSDGILQRETAMLLRSEAVRSRIHRLVLSASDALGAMGGLTVLREEFGLVPHALSGRLTASPLMVRELRANTDIPVFDNQAVDVEAMREILV